MDRHDNRADGVVRLHDVAAYAGVSSGTVSNTINHPERVLPRTRKLVNDAITALGYIPNQQARMLMGVASEVIGLVVLDVESPFYMETAHAIERAVRRTGQVVMLSTSDGDLDREAALLRVLAAQGVRGAMIAPSTADVEAARYRDLPRALPVILLDFDGGSTHCSVSVDNHEGGRLAVRHLLERGHTSLAYISGPAHFRQFADRAEGARAEMRAQGRDPSEHLVEVSSPGIGIQDGQAAAERLLAECRPTAVLCGNDMIAFGAYRAFAAAGLRVPDDIAIVGYDDIDVAKDWIVPMSTIRQPIDDIGANAARLMIDHSSGDPDHEHEQVVLQPELVVRRSTGG